MYDKLLNLINTLKMKNKILSIFVFILLFASCTKDFESYNTDKKNPATTPGDPLFTSGTIALVDQLYSTNVNVNVWKLFSQYWTETTYVDEVNYNVLSRNIPDLQFRIYYRDILRDLKESRTLISAETPILESDKIVKNNKLLIIDILSSYTYQQLVDMFGNVPYSEALQIEDITPAYDDAFTIYKDLIVKVNTALTGLDDSYGSFGSADPIYNGNVASWKKFANSLKIKLGIAIADADATLAQTTIESAFSGAFTSKDDEAVMEYFSYPPYQNPLYDDLVASGRHDFVPANTIVDLMNQLKDPRRSAYFTLYYNATLDTFIYKGGTYGVRSSYAKYSHINDNIQVSNYPGTVMSYTEVLFYLAEAAARGFNVGQTADVLYYNAISSSILEWGGTSADISAYFLEPDVVYNTADWRKCIGTQSWLASYVRGFEGYTTWRRLDYPIFTVAPRISGYDQIPVRFTYPVNEQTLNADNYYNAASAIGGDIMTTKLFWDKF
jgi:hypothetical protein